MKIHKSNTQRISKQNVGSSMSEVTLKHHQRHTKNASYFITRINLKRTGIRGSPLKSGVVSVALELREDFFSL